MLSQLDLLASSTGTSPLGPSSTPALSSPSPLVFGRRPVAIREGQAFADTVFGKTPVKVDYGCIPSAVFSQPPLAGVGLTEGQARNKYGSIRVFSSDFRPMKNVFAGRQERGLYKLVVDAATDKVLGLHMIGPEAPEILQAAAIAVKAGLTKGDFDATVALHPSMAEELVLMR